MMRTDRDNPIAMHQAENLRLALGCESIEAMEARFEELGRERRKRLSEDKQTTESFYEVRAREIVEMLRDDGFLASGLPDAIIEALIHYFAEWLRIHVEAVIRSAEFSRKAKALAGTNKPKYKYP